jgi:hypothetical protein
VLEKVTKERGMEDKIMLAVLVAGYLSCKGGLLLPLYV